MKGGWVWLGRSLGVVGEEMRGWKGDRGGEGMVMKRKGKSGGLEKGGVG